MDFESLSTWTGGIHLGFGSAVGEAVTVGVTSTLGLCFVFPKTVAAGINKIRAMKSVVFMFSFSYGMV